MSSTVAQRAVQLFASQAEFLLSRRASGEVVLIVETAKERRFALVAPEEAVPYVENMRGPGEALAELKTNAESINGGAEGFVWLVVALGDERAYFTVQAKPKATPEPFETLRERAIAALNKQVETAGLPVFALDAGLVVVTIQGERKRFEVVHKADGLALARRWGLNVADLEGSPGEEPGMHRRWIIASVDGNPIYFWFNFIPRVGTTNN